MIGRVGNGMRDVSGYGSLRKHQLRALEVADEISNGKRHGQKVITAGITPGGGKTLMASLFANALADAGAIDRVLVVVPNDPLRKQMLESFHSPSRGLDRYLNASTKQELIPGTGRPFGRCITYQKLTTDRAAKKLAKWVAGGRTLVVFDECHHLCEQRAWERGSIGLVNAAALVLCMSGTLLRWDEERVPFIAYDDRNRAVVDIRYSRAEALEEQAVLNVEFKLVDGRTLYEYRDVPHDTHLSSAPEKEQPRTLKAALEAATYSEDFVVAALTDWERYREQRYPSSAIVVCHNQKAARRAMGFVRKHFPKHNAALSLCADGAIADRAIKRFRSGDVTVLVTVKKAYEGLDVPNASHLIYLGDVRSWPFLDQVIARVTRFNPTAPLAWAEQRGHVYTPDDMRMRHYIQSMLSEVEAYFRERQRGGGISARPPRSSFRPDDAEVTDIGNGIDGRILTDAENAGVAALEAMYPPMKVRFPLEMKLELAYKLGLVPKEIDDAAE